VIDPTHLDSADDFEFGAYSDDSDHHVGTGDSPGGSYDSAFGPDMNIEYAGLITTLIPFSFCLMFTMFKFLHALKQLYTIIHFYQPSFARSRLSNSHLQWSWRMACALAAIDRAQVPQIS
jgi:hypothetical protein